MAAGQDASLCPRCHERKAVTKIRTESACQDCFSKYFTSKIVKRMETFRARNAEPGQQRHLLLPLSLGPASVSLLHVLSGHLKRQAQNAWRTGFRLHVLHIEDDKTALPIIEEIKQRYPEHIYSSCGISDVLVEDPSVRGLFPSNPSQHNELDSLLASIGSTTSRIDVQNILRNRLIVAFAKSHGCEAIIWADSTTRLAEKTLAETAKGRGFALPWLVNDGLSPQGLPFYYPLRELLTKEIIMFAAFEDPPLLYRKEDISITVSSKNATIDSLMRQYFRSAEQEYPSIVANVVRTTGKLQQASLNNVELQCELCEMPLQGQSPERSRLCYGCIRSFG